VHSRFHSDRAIPSSVANESRAQWVVNSVNNPEHHVLMAVSNNIPTGFVVFRRTDDAEGAEARLDIIAVNPEFRQQGIGAGLVAAFLMRARQIGCGVAIVGTQAHNIK
jgi:GNAT superfamily N-acetyltransferase